MHRIFVLPVALLMATHDGVRFVVHDRQNAPALRSIQVRASGLVTASLGVTASNGTSTPTPLSLVAAADSALYRAKSRGRDRVEAQEVSP